MNQLKVMKFVAVFNFISVLCVFSNSQKTSLDSPRNVLLLQKVKSLVHDSFEKSGENKRMRRIAREKRMVQDPVPENVPFPCSLNDSRSPVVPTSVHKLRPGDIDVIAAIGDSLTAGVGAFATNIIHVLSESRGVSFSGGGEGTWRQYLTIPNIIKEFNPRLIGYAKSNSYAFQDTFQLNLATSGAMSQDLPFMAEKLVERIKNHPKVDIKNHWKYISIMIGGNNFCSDMCYLSEPSFVIENHKSNLTMALRIIRDNLPRTFVSLSPPPHIEALYFATGRTPLCDLALDFECPCVFGSRWDQQRSEFFDIMTKCQLKELEIAKYPEFQRNDFAVVVQPVTINLTLPSLENGNSDFTNFAFDCFHVSQKGYARVANAIWNNLFEPVDKKTAGWETVFEKFHCPTSKRPYIATSENSHEDIIV